MLVALSIGARAEPPPKGTKKTKAPPHGQCEDAGSFTYQFSKLELPHQRPPSKQDGLPKARCGAPGVESLSNSGRQTPPRVKSKQSRPSPYSRGGHRRKDVEKLIRFRHGLLPNTDDADLYVREIAECHGKILFERRSKVTEDAIFERLDIWCNRWAPTFPRHLRHECAAHAKKQKGQLSDDEKVGVRLRLRHEERTFLDIRTIGCYDVDKKIRKLLAAERKRKRDKERKARERILERRQSRPEYLATHRESRDKPWIRMRVSRRTYYRCKKAGTLPEWANAVIAHEQPGILLKVEVSSKVQGPAQ